MKRLFAKQSSQGLRAFFLIVLSLIMFFCDHRYHCFDIARSKIFLVALPIQRAVNWPVQIIHSFSLSIARKKAIVEENERLISELLLINTKLQRVAFLERENAQLRSLLYGSKKIKGKILFAELIRSGVNSLGQTAMIDKGKLDGVYLGQPVLDESGLLGQVILSHDRSSKVLLITSNKSAVPVMLVRNGLQTVAVGKGNNSYLELANITKTADIKIGDSIVTSGLGQTFPAGYSVGVVKDIKHIVGDRFEKVLVEPEAKINRVLHVMLVWPDSNKKTGAKRSRKEVKR